MRSKSFYDLLYVYNVIQVLKLENAVVSLLHLMLIGVQLASFCVLVLDSQFVFKAPCLMIYNIFKKKCKYLLE